MSLKTQILKRKLAKTSNPMEMFVAQNLYSVLEDLVKAEHENNAEKVSQLTDQLANNLNTYSEELKKVLDNHKNAAIARLTSTEKDLKTVGSSVESNLNNTVSELELKVRKTVDGFNQTVATITSNLEKLRGPQGIAGKPGTNGTNGSPDTAEQVVAKVNKAKGVKMSAIDGLQEELRVAKKSGGGGKSGGGMGNVQHEVKNVGSATASFTINYKVAAGGNAAWLRYQGQMLVFGTDYTISGTTVTLLFTPVDSTYVDCTYIRG